MLRLRLATHHCLVPAGPKEGNDLRSHLVTAKNGPTQVTWVGPFLFNSDLAALEAETPRSINVPTARKEVTTDETYPMEMRPRALRATDGSTTARSSALIR